MIAQRVQERSAWLDRDISFSAVHVQRNVHRAGDRFRRCNRFAGQHLFVGINEMIGDGGAGTGHPNPFEKFSPARVVFGLLLPIVLV